MLVAVNIIGMRPGHGGGEELFIRRVLDKVRDIQKGTEFLLLSEEDDWNIEGATYAKANSIASIDKAINKSGADLLFTPIQSAPRSCSVPVVLLVMELYEIAKDDKPKRFLGTSPLKEARDIAAHAAAVIVPSEFMKRESLSVLGVPLNKIVVAPLGVDEAFAEDQHCIVQKPYFLVVGSLAERKNIPSLLEAFSRVSQDIEHNLVVVAHPTEDEPEYWGPRVVRIDRVGTAQLAGLYQHSDLFICPSVYEGSGVLVLEALKSGARVATGRVGGILEVAGDAPMFYNPESVDSLTGIMRRAATEGEPDHPHIRRMSKHITQEFTWEKTAWQTLAAFRRTLA